MISDLAERVEILGLDPGDPKGDHQALAIMVHTDDLLHCHRVMREIAIHKGDRVLLVMGDEHVGHRNMSMREIIAALPAAIEAAAPRDTSVTGIRAKHSKSFEPKTDNLSMEAWHAKRERKAARPRWRQ